MKTKKRKKTYWQKQHTKIFIQDCIVWIMFSSIAISFMALVCYVAGLKN